MDLFEAVKQRASVRSFEPAEIPEADLLRILDAGRRAPSGYNRQPWQFILVRERETLESLSRVQDCIGQAAAAVALVVDEEQTKYWKEDAGAAIENMLLAAVALGYASLWIEGYVLRHEELVKEILGVPDRLRVLALLPIGAPADEPQQAEKKPLSEILHRERFGG